MSTSMGEEPQPIRRSDRMREERFERFAESAKSIRKTWRYGTQKHLQGYDLMFDFLEEAQLVIVRESNPHVQKLHGDLLEWLSAQGYKTDTQQAKQPYTPLIKFFCYEPDQDIDNPGEKTRIATASLVLQAAMFYGRKPSVAIALDGGGTEGGLARVYRELRKKKGRVKKPKTPEELIASACEEVIGKAIFDAATLAKAVAGSNVLHMPDGEPVLTLGTRHGNEYHIHGWLDPADNVRAVKQILASAA